MACSPLSTTDCTMAATAGHGNELSNSFLDFAGNFAASVDWPFVGGWLFATAVFLALAAAGAIIRRDGSADLRRIGDDFIATGIKAAAMALTLLIGFALYCAVRP